MGRARCLRMMCVAVLRHVGMGRAFACRDAMGGWDPIASIVTQAGSGHLREAQPSGRPGCRQANIPSRPKPDAQQEDKHDIIFPTPYHAREAAAEEEPCAWLACWRPRAKINT